MKTKGLKGIDVVMKNLNKFVLEEKQKSFKGLIECGIAIRRETEKGSVITPLETSHLTNSWFITTITSSMAESEADKAVVAEAQSLTKAKKYPTMIFGYTANYASYVHEMAGVEWSRPGSGSYWLFKAMRKTEKEMLEILKENLEIKE